MEMSAVSLTLSTSCIRMQLSRSLTWPTVGSFGISLVDQGLRCVCGSVSGVLVEGSCSPPHTFLSHVDVREFFNFFVGARALSVSVAGSLWRVLGPPCAVRAFTVSIAGLLRFVLGISAAALWIWGRQLGISQPILGCRVRYGYPRRCAWVRGSSGPGAWHLLVPI